MHERRDRGHHHQHHMGQHVGADRPVDLQIAEPIQRTSSPLVAVSDRWVRNAIQERAAQRTGAGGGHTSPSARRSGGGRSRRGWRRTAAGGGYWSTSPQPFIMLTSSTAMVPRLRKKQTRIASPIAASAAATVSTKSVKTWPDQIAQMRREGDQVDVDRQQHELDRHQDDDHVACGSGRSRRSRSRTGSPRRSDSPSRPTPAMGCSAQSVHGP